MKKYEFVEISLGASGVIVNYAGDVDSEVERATSGINTFFSLVVAMGGIGWRPSDNPVNELYYFMKEIELTEFVKVEITTGRCETVTPLNEFSYNGTGEIETIFKEYKGFDESKYIDLALDDGWRIIGTDIDREGVVTEYIFGR